MYTNTDKQLLNEILENVKHCKIDRNLSRMQNLECSNIPQKSDVIEELIVPFADMDLESPINMELADYLNTYIRLLELDFDEISKDEYELAFSTAEYLLDRCGTLFINNCDLNINTPYLYNALEKTVKLERLVIDGLIDDTIHQVPYDFDNFSNIKLQNLKEIFLDLAKNVKQRNNVLSKILRVLSKNESLRSNLESFTFVNWNFYSNQHVFDILKAKSFGYLKCKVYEEHATEEYIELYKPKITKYD